MAGTADHEGLASPSCHLFRPRGLWLSRSVQVRQAANVVHRDAVGVAADLASVRQQPGDQLLVANDARNQDAVGDDRVFLPSEWDTAEPRDQWLPTTAFDSGFHALAWPVRSVDGGLVLSGHLRHRRAVLVRQGLQQRGLHDPVQPVKPIDVPGQQVVLDDAPILGPIGIDDGVVLLVDQSGPALGFAARQVRGALGLDHPRWNPQADRPVDGSSTCGDLAVVVGAR